MSRHLIEQFFIAARYRVNSLFAVTERSNRCRCKLRNFSRLIGLPVGRGLTGKREYQKNEWKKHKPGNHPVRQPKATCWPVLIKKKIPERDVRCIWQKKRKRLALTQLLNQHGLPRPAQKMAANCSYGNSRPTTKIIIPFY